MKNEEIEELKENLKTNCKLFGVANEFEQRSVNVRTLYKTIDSWASKFFDENVVFPKKGFEERIIELNHDSNHFRGSPRATSLNRAMNNAVVRELWRLLDGKL